MCGRLSQALQDQRFEHTRDLFRLDLSQVPNRYNLAPTQALAIIETVDQQSQLRMVKWGIKRKIGASSKLIINARGEKVLSHFFYRNSFTQHRCLVPTTGFFEWKAVDGVKFPYFFMLNSRHPFYLAGFIAGHLSEADPDPRCVIVTTEPNALMAPINHTRNPVILDNETALQWLDSAESALELIRPYPAELMSRYPVSRRVNRVAVDDPSLIDPVPEEHLLG